LALYKKTYLHFNNLETAGTSGSDVNDLFGIEAVETVSLGVTDDTGKLILLVLEVNIAAMLIIRHDFPVKTKQITCLA
jgi:hypothetical protein